MPSTKSNIDAFGGVGTKFEVIDGIFYDLEMFDWDSNDVPFRDIDDLNSFFSDDCGIYTPQFKLVEEEPTQEEARYKVGDVVDGETAKRIVLDGGEVMDEGRKTLKYRLRDGKIYCDVVSFFYGENNNFTSGNYVRHTYIIVELPTNVVTCDVRPSTLTTGDMFNRALRLYNSGIGYIGFKRLKDNEIYFVGQAKTKAIQIYKDKCDKTGSPMFANGFGLDEKWEEVDMGKSIRDEIDELRGQITKLECLLGH